MSIKPKTRVRVVSNRCGELGTLLVTLWKTQGFGAFMWACRPEHEAGWNGKPHFYSPGELEVAQ